MAAITELPCLCCGKAVHWDAESSGKQRSITSSNWGEAGTVAIHCGWGSRFDMGGYHAVICDDCIESHADRLRQVRLVSRQPEDVLYCDGLEPAFFDSLAIGECGAKFTARNREQQMELARREFMESLKPDSEARQ